MSSASAVEREVHLSTTNGSMIAAFGKYFATWLEKITIFAVCGWVSVSPIFVHLQKRNRGVVTAKRSPCSEQQIVVNAGIRDQKTSCSSCDYHACSCTGSCTTTEYLGSKEQWRQSEGREEEGTIGD